MNRFVRWKSYPAHLRQLLVKTSILLAMMHLGLRVLPFYWIRGYTGRLSQAPASRPTGDERSLNETAWAVERAGRRLLGENACLAKALTGQILLGRQGYPVSLRIGTMKNGEGRLEAHAWLEVDGQVVIGGPAQEVEKFSVLSELNRGGC